MVSIKTCWFINYLTRKMFPKCRVNHTTSWIIGLDVEHEDIEVPIRTIFKKKSLINELSCGLSA
ncbi:unnamed protein product [Brassica rapa subsp. narinosa]